MARQVSQIKDFFPTPLDRADKTKLQPLPIICVQQSSVFSSWVCLWHLRRMNPLRHLRLFGLNMASSTFLYGYVTLANSVLIFCAVRAVFTCSKQRAVSPQPISVACCLNYTGRRRYRQAAPLLAPLLHRHSRYYLCC